MPAALGLLWLPSVIYFSRLNSIAYPGKKESTTKTANLIFWQIIHFDSTAINLQPAPECSG